jgi:hypothetical protein
MRNATKVTVSTFGVLAGLGGIRHGIGEVLQGNITPSGIISELSSDISLIWKDLRP